MHFSLQSLESDGLYKMMANAGISRQPVRPMSVKTHPTNKTHTHTHRERERERTRREIRNPQIKLGEPLSLVYNDALLLTKQKGKDFLFRVFDLRYISRKKSKETRRNRCPCVTLSIRLLHFRNKTPAAT